MGIEAEPSTLVELLRSRAVQHPEQRLFTFLVDGDSQEIHMSYGELDRQARAVGALLQGMGLMGKRALVLFPPGLELLTATWGCQYAGMVLIYTYPPDPARLVETLPQFLAIAKDSQASVVLTTHAMLAMAEPLFQIAPELKTLQWIATDNTPPDAEKNWKQPDLSPKDLAFLQYTSGSTGRPKGVMFSHKNILHQLIAVSQVTELSPKSTIVSWVPLYHNLGIGMVTQAIIAGSSLILMSPLSFLQRPLSWLQAISRYKATFSLGPNFAYELCAQQIKSEEKVDLDLSNWELAICGAEPIRPETLDRFVTAFSPCGFRREAFTPAYGLTEATLTVSSGLKGISPLIKNFQKEALQQNRVIEVSPGENGNQTVMACGRPLPNQKTLIVHPESLTPSEPNEVGEIWISSPGVALGYWNQPEENNKNFKAYLSNTGEGPFLRTGDLGFLKDGELFVTGRLKELIIIRGRNHYPQDIEQTVQQCHPALRVGCGAAFSIDIDNEERLVLVQEADHSEDLKLEKTIGNIREAVTKKHGIQPYAIVLIKPDTIPRTRNNKIQHQACRSRFLEGSLEVVSSWQVTEAASSNKNREAVTGTASATPSTDQPKPLRSNAEIQSWLVSKFAERLKIDPREIQTDQPFARYGLDSMNAVALAGELEAWLDRSLSATLAWDYPTIESLSSYLAGESVDHEIPDEIQDQAAQQREPIAIIGMGCRFPGAKNPESFWKLLRDGVDTITEVPPDRWDIDAVYDKDPGKPGKMNTRWGGFLERVDGFDAEFFNITPREASRMDPQQRLLLEVSWEAFEDAGLPLQRLRGSPTGVFVGICGSDYSQFQLSDPESMDAYFGTGIAHSIAANRLSYFFDLRGPSLAIDTACSSSLVAVHQACQSLWNRECSLALAGGVNVILSPEITIYFSQAGAMAPDGRCKAFDADANGFVRSEGAGAVVLKPLALALADGDSVYAVIRGSAINSDGQSNGLFAPNRLAQEAVLRKAYHRAKISPSQVQYVEAHGTGTAIGDPIEALALGSVLSQDRAPGNLCVIGSAKTNIGHLEAASGISGLIKTTLALKHKIFPASLHFKKPNPRIPFKELPLKVQQKTEPWMVEANKKRLAGVSSFGFGGTNAHVVLEEAPHATPSQQVTDSSEYQLLTLSARSIEALNNVVQNFKEFLATDHTNSFSDICYTANVRRSPLDHRLALVARSKEEAISSLEAYLKEEARPGLSVASMPSSKRNKLVFAFSGTGSQWLGMGRQLLAQEQVFRSTIERCDQILQTLADWSVLAEIQADSSQSRLENTAILHPLLFVVQVALSNLWRSWGIIPDAIVGHSVAEIAAAHVAGVLTLEDAIKIVFHRSLLIQSVAGQGKTAIVDLTWEEAQNAIEGFEDRVSVAGSNSPSSTLLSGDPAALAELLQKLDSKKIFGKMIHMNYASHGFQMEPLREEFVKLIQDIRPQAAKIPIYSTVTGQLSEGTEFNAEYWGRNLREPVQFSKALQQIIKDDHDIFLEISPHPVLLGSISQTLQYCDREGKILPTLKRQEDERRVMFGSLGTLHTLGRSVNWSALYPSRGKVVSLPHYPWQRERHWFDMDNYSKSPALPLSRTRSPFSLENIRDWFYELQWQARDRVESEHPHVPLSSRQKGSWLIFSDKGGLGERLETLLKARGEKCIVVYPGRRLEKISPNHYRINPGRLEDSKHLLKRLLSSARSPFHNVIHLWGLEATPTEKTSVTSLEKDQTTSLLSVVNLVKTLGERNGKQQPLLWFVTRGSQAVRSDCPPLAIAQAPIWGMGRSLALEYPKLWGGLIDLDPKKPKNEAALLLEEICNPDKEDQLAFRAGQRYVLRLVHSPIPKEKIKPYSFHPDGTYLITGGLGALGLEIASRLVENGARRLVLLGRRRLPIRETWEKLSKESAHFQTISKIQALEKLGVTIHMAQADVSNEKQMRAVLRDLKNTLPPLRGVIHAAGTQKPQLLKEMDQDAFLEILKPKTIGTWILHHYTMDLPLDFFVSFSSTSAIFGAKASGPYSAANHFLDAFAHYRKSLGLTGLAINWGNWSDVGMAALGNSNQFLSLLGFQAMNPKQALHAFEYCLGAGAIQPVVASIDWSIYKPLYEGASNRRPLLEQIDASRSPKNTLASEGSQEFLRNLKAAPAEEREKSLLSYLQALMEKVLGLQGSRVDPQQPLSTLGVDSLVALDLKCRIENDLGITIPLASLIQDPNLVQFTQELLNQLNLAPSIPPNKNISKKSITASSNNSHWFVFPKTNRKAKIRLFCFPYAGGGPSTFHSWSHKIPDSIEICSVQLPGREARLKEPCFNRLEPLIKELRQAIRPYVDMPFAFFGHCMGSLVMFEVARQLQKDFDRSPIHFFVSACRAPQIYAFGLREHGSPPPEVPAHALPEALFLEVLKLFNFRNIQEFSNNEELKKLFLPTLRGDFEVCETYSYLAGSPLQCPISVFGGLEDPEVRPHHLEAWREQTLSSFSLSMLPGDHYFLTGQRSIILEKITNELLQPAVKVS